MPKTPLHRRVATRVETIGPQTQVRYHGTCVVAFDPQRIILSSGGWHTATTKKRMNEVSEEFDLGFEVFQTRHEWFVTFAGRTVPFTDGMTLHGKHPNSLPEDQEI